MVWWLFVLCVGCETQAKRRRRGWSAFETSSTTATVKPYLKKLRSFSPVWKTVVTLNCEVSEWRRSWRIKRQSPDPPRGGKSHVVTLWDLMLFFFPDCGLCNKCYCQRVARGVDMEVWIVSFVFSFLSCNISVCGNISCRFPAL